MQQTTRRFWSVRACAGLCLLAAMLSDAHAQQQLTVAAFPAVDEIVRSAIPQWKRSHPTVDIKVVSRQFSDHHTAMATASGEGLYFDRDSNEWSEGFKPHGPGAVK